MGSGIRQGNGGRVPVTAANENAPKSTIPRAKIPPRGEVAPLTGFNHLPPCSNAISLWMNEKQTYSTWFMSPRAERFGTDNFSTNTLAAPSVGQREHWLVRCNHTQTRFPFKCTQRTQRKRLRCVKNRIDSIVAFSCARTACVSCVTCASVLMFLLA